MTGNFIRWLVICWTAASRTTRNWMLARNTSCHVSFTLQPVELRICCKIAKLAGSISAARAGQSACYLSSFFQWPMKSSSVCPLPKKHSEASWSVMMIFCHFVIVWRVTWNLRICGNNLSQVFYTRSYAFETTVQLYFFTGWLAYLDNEAFGADKGEEHKAYDGFGDRDDE